MGKGTDIYIDAKNNAVFISVGKKVTDESIVKVKEGLRNNHHPYDAVYILENINSVQYVSEQQCVSEQKIVEFGSDRTFKYTD